MPNLLVPGTGGITLVDSDGVDVGWPVLMRIKGIIRGVQGKSDQELFERMGMEHVPGQLAPAKTSLQAGISLHPGHVLRVAYNQFEDLNSFLFDWRADLRHSAASLRDFLVQIRPTGGKWNLVGHSQGALLIILASKMMDAEDSLSEFVSTATLVAPPVAGTLNAAKAMLVGDNAGERLAPVMRRTIRTWPASYQMLPSWSAVLKGDDAPAAESRQLKETGGWPGEEGIQPDLLLRAREVQPQFEDPLSHFEGVDAKFYWARNRDTATGIGRPPSGPLGYRLRTKTKGDSLVPFETTVRWLGDKIGPGDVTVFKAPCEQHAYMLNDPIVSASVKARLR